MDFVRIQTRGTIIKVAALVVMALSSTLARAATISGRVVNSGGEGIGYAYVYTEGKRHATQCDGQGLFKLTVPEGRHHLTASCMGYGEASIEAVAGDTAVVIRLKANNMLEALTVTATRTQKTLANTPVVTRVISSEDIRRTDATNIRDVLENELPGIEFTYSMNQQLSVSLQGMGGMSVLFLVDGERLAGETLDNTDFARLNMDNIERIEIIKGAATALYGSNAVGAVINIITKTDREPLTAQLNGRVGSRYGQYRYGGNIGFCKGRWANMLNVQTDGMDSYTVRDADGDSTRVYGNRQWNFKDKLTYVLDDHSTVTGRAGYYFHERDASATDKDRARAFSGGLRYENRLADGGKAEVSYTFERYDKSDYYPATGREYLDYKNVQNSLRAMYNHPFGEELDVTVGADAMSDYLMSYQFADDDNSHSQVTADLFAQADWEPGTNWSLVGGVRADYFSKYGVEITPKMAAMYKMGNCRFRASYSKGFRAPTLKEMYMDFNMANIFTIYGNDSLESEVSHSFSLSAEYVRKKFCATLTGYMNHMKNEIGTIWDPTLDGGMGAMIYRNTAGSDLGSVDLTLTASLPLHTSAKVAYTFFHEFRREGGYNFSDSRPHSLLAQLSYARTFKNFDLAATLSGRWLSAVKYYTLSGSYDSYAETSSPSYTLWKLMLSQKIRNKITLSLTVDNLFDYKPKKYMYNLPYTQGRTYLVGMSLDI